MTRLIVNSAFLCLGVASATFADCPFGGFVEVESRPLTVIVMNETSPGQSLGRPYTVVVETPARYDEAESPGVTVIVQTPASFNEALSPSYSVSTLLGDLDYDNAVTIADLAILLSNFGRASGADYIDGDLSGDGSVSLSDLSLMLSEFGSTCQ